MKYYLFLLLFCFSTIGFSQSEPKGFKDKQEEFEYYAKPNPSNELSRYITNHIDYKLLDNYIISDTIKGKSHVYLTFKFNEEKQVVGIKVTSPYSELNNNITEAFKKYDIDKLAIPEKNLLNIYVLQILERAGDKMIVNCSTHILYEKYPVYEGCESANSYSKMKSCIDKLLEAHIAKNISSESIKKAKILGKLTLKPAFIINEKGAVELIPNKNPKDSLSIELNRVLALFPTAISPPFRNGKPTRLLYKGTVHLQIDSENKEFVADVIKSKDSVLNPNNELALHFKKFIGEKDLNATIFKSSGNNVSIRFGIDKKGKMIDLKANSANLAFNTRLIDVFRQFPFEKLNINSTNVLESYSFTIISKAYPVNIIQCNDKPNVYIPAHYDKSCLKSDSSEDLWKCFNEKMNYYITSNFDTSVRYKTKLTGEIRIICKFQVDENAKIINVKVQAPNPSFANEMEEMLKDMPSFYKPAYLNGVAIKSSYSVPVVLNLSRNTSTEDPFKSSNKRFK